MNKTVGDLHCPLPHRRGTFRNHLCIPCDPTTLNARKPSSRGKVLTLAIATWHPGDVHGHSQEERQ